MFRSQSRTNLLNVLNLLTALPVLASVYHRSRDASRFTTLADSLAKGLIRVKLLSVDKPHGLPVEVADTVGVLLRWTIWLLSSFDGNHLIG